MSMKYVKEHLPWPKKITSSARELARIFENTIIGSKAPTAQTCHEEVLLKEQI